MNEKYSHNNVDYLELYALCGQLNLDSFTRNYKNWKVISTLLLFCVKMIYK